MQVILSRQQAEELIAKIDANFEIKGRPIQEKVRPRAVILYNRLEKLFCFEKDLRWKTDYIELRQECFSKIHGRPFKFDFPSEFSWAADVGGEDKIPCEGYEELRGLLDSEFSNQIIMDGDVLEKLQEGVDRDFKEGDFFDIDYLERNIKRSRDDLFQILRNIKKVTGRYPVERMGEEDDKTASNDRVAGWSQRAKSIPTETRSVYVPPITVFGVAVFFLVLCTIATLVAKFG